MIVQNEKKQRQRNYSSTFILFYEVPFLKLPKSSMTYFLSYSIPEYLPMTIYCC